MAELTAALVKELREKTGAGMLDCKKALTETSGDIEAAVDWLRKKGLSAAAKKSSRVAAEGLVAVLAEGPRGAVLEVNAETDFVARNEQFQAFAKAAVAAALKAGLNDIEKLRGTALPDGKTVGDTLTHLIATIGENMTLRRVQTVSVGHGVVSGYVHSPVSPGVGKIGVLVALDSKGEAAKLADTAKQLAMHVAAARPDALTVADVDPAKIAREKAIIAEQTAASGKPPDIVTKMVDGRMRKYYEEVVLMEQTSVIDGETRIKQVIETAAKTAGAPVSVASFVRYALGEGIEKQQTDFAAEVAAQAKLA